MGAWGKRLVALGVAVVFLAVAVLVASAVHLLPQLRNPFAEKTEERSGPVLLQSIVELSRYEAASGSFQVIVDITTSSILPSFLVGSDTMFVGVGTDNSYVDFSRLKGDAVKVSDDRLSATITLPHAQLEPANLDVKESYVYAQQQGLFTRVNDFLNGNPNSQQALYELAQKKIGEAAGKSTLVADAERNTKTMLVGLLQSLGFKNITVTYADNAAG
ncbi:DUF4230 domain-containing protein [Amycolatopsis sp. NPDC101161]|uniref:DUF4230 domain-containing protein n=1 Tax=Amycolatopsis sp. NPDC101161 TaxID=3363940 RepID=UPI0037F31E5A